MSIIDKLTLGFLTLLYTLLLGSCVDYSDTTQAIQVDVQVKQPSDLTASIQLGGHTVTLTREDGKEMTATTDDKGIAHFSGLVPDIYTISTSWSLSAEEYQQVSGDAETTQGAVIAGSSHSQLLAQDYTATPLTLATQLSITRSIVISKVYYAGTKDVKKKNYLAVQYIELYNQSDDSVDVAGMYLGLVESNASPAYSLDELTSEYQDSVVVLKQLYRIPADESHIIPPGGSVVITNSAVDHSENLGTSFDLSRADFEAKDAKGKTLNNPDTKAMELVYSAFSAISKMNMLQGGPCGVVLFRQDADAANWPKVYSYGKTSGSQWLCASLANILDGVEILKYKNTGTIDLATKRIVTKVDAGATYIHSVSGYNGETVYRKKSSRKGSKGQYILQDTNNSTNDFSASTDIMPRNYEY